MNLCKILEEYIGYLFMTTFIVGYLYMHYRYYKYVFSVKKKENNLPKYYQLKLFFFLGMYTAPVWITNPALRKEHKAISIRIPILILFILLLWAVFGLFLIEICEITPGAHQAETGK